MAPLNRRQFIKSGIAGITGAALSGQITFANSALPPENHKIPQVSLGQTGIKISQIGLGTGSVAYNKSSNQTRLGMEQFVKLARHAYMANALKHMSREKVELCSKIWTYPNGSDKIVPVEQSLDRFRKEIGTDYIDILLMHCLMEPGWTQSRSYYIDALSKAKQDGIVKAVGVSCHNWEAMVEAVDSPWVDVILARINPFQSNMDGTPDAVNKLLGKAVKNGKGVIGMKIFGEGKNVSVEERERSLHFAIHEANIHCMTIGLESIAQIDDLVERVSKTL